MTPCLAAYSRTVHTEASDATTEFRATLAELGIAQRRVARLFGVTPRSVRRWQYGDRRLPRGVGIVLRLLATGTVTVDQLEQAIPTQTNGGAKSEPLVSLEEPPAPLEEAPERAKTAALAVCALTPEACRWPHGDAQLPGFRFFGNRTVEPPYCPRHRAAAYVAPLVDSTASKRFAHLDFKPAGSRCDLLRAIGRSGHLIEGGAEPIAR